ncbi:RNase adapter RapZ [Synergistaceae bacterium OttesenSCG-928-D05]|nr:RNase adapter RapZ [Synergistaceae bacterium OttesenSCG-928-D05]
MEAASGNKIKRCVIITGMSGAGKSSALNIFEDQGFYAIDNLPPSLLPQLLDVLEGHQSAVSNGVAAVVDVRGEELLKDLDQVIVKLRERVQLLEVVFVEASDGSLVRRFETTRRRHPLGGESTILGSIASERKLVSLLKKEADVVIDTSDLNVSEFRTRLLSVMGVSTEGPTIFFSSFGFKHGIPQDSDYVLDVRFLPNPNYVEELHALSGKDEDIQNYLRDFKELDQFLSLTKPLLEFILSVYGNTGKNQFHVAVGCTGGRHRSVAIAEILVEHFRKEGHKVLVYHRDIDKGNLW